MRFAKGHTTPRLVAPADVKDYVRLTVLRVVATSTVTMLLAHLVGAFRHEAWKKLTRSATARFHHDLSLSGTQLVGAGTFHEESQSEGEPDICGFLCCPQCYDDHKCAQIEPFEF